MSDFELLEARRIQQVHSGLLRTERSCLADLLLSIGDFESRGLHRVLGHAGIFDYLHRALRMSRGMAHYRMVGARLVRRFPEVEAPVRDGRLCLTTVVEVARVLTDANREVVLPRFFGLSRREAREVAMEIAPLAVVPRRTVVTVRGQGEEAKVLDGAESGIAASTAAPAAGADCPASRQSSIVELQLADDSTVRPMTATESRLHITVSREFLSLLRMAKTGESHRHPGANDEFVLRLALEALLEKQAKRRACVPAKVKRDVVKRDQGRCQWPVDGGGVCGATLRLEVDHVHPRGKGGADTVDNTRLLCRTHNLEAAREAYGDEVMDSFTRPGSRPFPAPP